MHAILLEPSSCEQLVRRRNEKHNYGRLVQRHNCELLAQRSYERLEQQRSYARLVQRMTEKQLNGKPLVLQRREQLGRLARLGLRMRRSNLVLVWQLRRPRGWRKRTIGIIIQKIRLATALEILIERHKCLSTVFLTNFNILIE